MQSHAQKGLLRYQREIHVSLCIIMKCWAMAWGEPAPHTPLSTIKILLIIKKVRNQIVNQHLSIAIVSLNGSHYNVWNVTHFSIAYLCPGSVLSAGVIWSCDHVRESVSGCRARSQSQDAARCGLLQCVLGWPFTEHSQSWILECLG